MIAHYPIFSKLSLQGHDGAGRIGGEDGRAVMVGVEPVERASLADSGGQRHIAAQAIIPTSWPCRPNLGHQPDIFSLDVGSTRSAMFVYNNKCLEYVEFVTDKWRSPRCW